MLIIPAIDLKDGQCVRLQQGRMEDATVFGSDPVEMAGRWVEAGCRRLHLVDLNGAFEGKPMHAEVVAAISHRYPQLPIQIGGGIRNIDIIEAYVEAGVSWCIIGTAAVKDPGFVREACSAFPGKIIVGIDAKDGLVATEGWADVSEVKATDLARDFADAGVSAIVYTDIARDGMMQGVNLEATVEVAQAGGIPVIASGGVTDIHDIERLCTVADKGLLGAITGRAIYEGKLDVRAAQAYCDEQTGAK
ncbi:1-(5-phosphoribosyl)-5-[(5-phosphoribosylamino)methylideneamino]imidazole-4-carboxamide isomerase [Saccharospirillum sp. MSK14-1]|uniref:1-(5-phosphoribosyl)-5-[(5- phosphoribosylamino)methylideneamino]imidazole-4- carboxamide isomerase n=1 Tax=Saccharospirillum sp. MSK14-1 TaxID=1897632 RepID=UPI000D3CB958|nr:1-(5-phosphoribosyl)-5-[(5-phosphoribosylamino)methylideneamino]imidazole-4-carboxamide isomerase [Saccharospirillum sp. MSK14-1]PTY35882.1 1-(5-phosphoribosyl)-5-[(5-phosphoribosylamino)methylideneamino]imidazole-4-carboxamide isomerase [Saccharospirillum sp. MSK14-1]